MTGIAADTSEVTEDAKPKRPLFKLINRIMTVATLILAALFIMQLMEFLSFRKTQDDAATAQAVATTEAFETEIADLLSRVEAEGRKLGERFGANNYTDEEVRELIRQTSLDFPEIRGVTACYEPFGLSPDRRLYCPYYFKVTGDYIYVEDNYDYTARAAGSMWYGDVIDNGAKWVEPYYGSGAREWYVDYGVPFTYESGDKAGQTRGMIDFSLEVGDFQALAHQLAVGKTSRSYIVSPQNTFISHPVQDYVGTRGIDDMLEREELDPVLRTAFENLRNGKTGEATYFDSEAQDNALVYYDRLPGSDFGIMTVFYRSVLSNDTASLNRRYINMALLLAAILVLGLIRFFARDQLDYYEIEGLSITTTILLLGVAILIGTLQHSAEVSTAENDSPPIANVSELGTLIGVEEARAKRLKVDAPIIVPTGLYIERLEFADSYNVNVSGQIWQKYPLSIADNVETGIRLPQTSPFAESSLIEEAYRKDIVEKEGEEGYRLIGYDMRVTLRLNLTYKDYPFDKRHLDIRIAPQSHLDNLLFVPDLAAYTDTNPRSVPGISPDIQLPGNRMVESYFNFSTEDFATDFGFSGQSQYQHVPMLHFNIHQKRLLLNAFVTYLIPIFVTVALIYILILASEKTAERQGIIESMAAFFFVLIFSHIDLRKDIVTADLIFMEFFYFITYLMIILSTFNLIAFTKSRVGWFDWHDNQLYRALYFPIFLTLLLIVMLVKFY